MSVNFLIPAQPDMFLRGLALCAISLGVACLLTI